MKKTETSNRELERAGMYDLSTPTLDAFQRKQRKQVRFPRYYKRELNW